MESLVSIAIKMSARGNFVCALICILMAFVMQGCGEEKSPVQGDATQEDSAIAYNPIVISVCKSPVLWYVDFHVSGNLHSDLQQCNIFNKDSVDDDAEACAKSAVAKWAVLEGSKNDELQAKCAQSVSKAVEQAGGNYLVAADASKTWLTEQMKDPFDASETATVAATPGVKASVIFYCGTLVESQTHLIVNSAKTRLAAKCQEGAAKANIEGAVLSCFDNGLKALDAKGIAQITKVTGECVNNAEEGHDWFKNKLSEFLGKVSPWFNANQEVMNKNTDDLTDTVLNEAATEGIVTLHTRLYDSRQVYRFLSNSSILVATATSALLTLFIGAFLLRMRRSARTPYEAAEAVEDREIELE